MNVTNLNSKNLVVDWLSFNLEGSMDSIIIDNHLAKHFTLHVLIDNVPTIGFHVLKKNIKFPSANIRDLEVTGFELRLFSLEETQLIFINLLKLKNGIGVF